MMFDVRRFDIYRKVPKDLTQPTYTGAAISVCSILFILFLLISEFYGFINVEISSVLFVDMPSDIDKIDVRLNVSLPNMKCEHLGLDIQDEMGRHEVGFHENTQKIGINDGVGCQFEGIFKVNKVPGNFHLSTHGASKQGQYQAEGLLHRLVVRPIPYSYTLVCSEQSQTLLPVPLQYVLSLLASISPQHFLIHLMSVENARQRLPSAPDMSHILNSLQFGEQIMKDIPGAFTALSNNRKTEVNALSSHDYIIKIVPTIYQSLDGTTTNSYQYTFAYKDYISYGHGHRVMPAIWFRYELSPITVKYEEKRKPLYHFITTVCAIVGGTFTVAGIIDSLVFTASEVFKKMEIGKLS